MELGINVLEGAVQQYLADLVEKNKISTDGTSTTVDNPYDSISSPYYKKWHGGADENANEAAAFDLAIKRAEWDSNMQLYKFELWYNSEIEKVRRLRQVGINPDLAGLDSASTTDAPSMSPAGNIGAQGAQIAAQNAANAAQVGKIIADTALMAISQGFTIASTLQTIKGIKLDNINKELRNEAQMILNDTAKLGKDITAIDRYSKIRETAAGKLFEYLGSTVDFDGDTDVMFDLVRSSSLPDFDSFTYTGDKAIDEAIFKEMIALRDNPELLQRYYSSYKSIQQSRQDIASIMSSPAYSDNMDEFISALKPLMNAEFDRKLQEVNTVISQLEYQQEYYDGLSGTAASSAANESNWNTAGQQKAASAYASAYRGMIVAAQEMMNAGNPLGALLLLVSNVVGEGLDVIKGTAGDALSTALGVSAAK